MTKGIVLALILQFCLSNISWTQERLQQLSIAQGIGFAKLQDQLWGNKIYKGFINNTALNYEWSTKYNRWNQLSFTGGKGRIELPNSIRESTRAYQFGINYQHLHRVTTFQKSKINWAIGGGVLTFVELRLQDQFSTNNFASYNIGSSLQIQNRLSKNYLLKNNKQLSCSLLIETAILTAHLNPDYANSDTEIPLGADALNELSLGTVLNRMRWMSIPTFFRTNISTSIDYMTNDKAGLRFQYNWNLMRVKRKLNITSSSHQINFGLFFRFGLKGEKQEANSKDV